jgi:2-iminoacetate synthase
MAINISGTDTGGTDTDRGLQFPTVSSLEAQVKAIDTRAVLKSGVSGSLNHAAVALALLRDTSISTDEVKAAAVRRIAARVPQLHTFVPLYTTNHCDSECKMCGMRKGNTKLVRKFAGKKALEEQLHILYEHERVRGVGFLTGEYQDEYTRLANAFRIGWAIRTALDIGFERIYFNIGSMVPDEIEVLGEWIAPEDPVTMCVFQETYDRGSYARFMGTDPQFPKSDYDRRVRSFDNWIDAGFRYVNPGVLLGLHDDIEAEAVDLVSHVLHLASRGAVVDVSLPRLRPAQGTRNASGVDDDKYLRVMAIIAFVCPEQRLVLTTREDQTFQNAAIDLCGVFSPGSPDVAPYRRSDTLINREESSQFLVADLRRPREILTSIEATGRVIQHFAGSDPQPEPATRP